MGFTGVVDPAVTIPEMRGYRAAHHGGHLTLRVLAMPYPELGTAAVPGVDEALVHLEGVGVGTGFGDDRLRLGPVKVYYDGEGMKGEALLTEPWHGADHGVQRLGAADFRRLAEACAVAGWGVGVHAVGSRAVEEVLDGFEAAARLADLEPLRCQLIHAYLEPSTASMARAARLGVVASLQPSIAWNNAAGLVARLGDRARQVNPMRDWLAAGARLAMGSDAPYFPCDPPGPRAHRGHPAHGRARRPPSGPSSRSPCWRPWRGTRQVRRTPASPTTGAACCERDSWRTGRRWTWTRPAARPTGSAPPASCAPWSAARRSSWPRTHSRVTRTCHIPETRIGCVSIYIGSKLGRSDARHRPPTTGDPTMFLKSNTAGVALVAVAGLTLSGCASGAVSDPDAPTDTINAEVWYAPATFDPAKASASADHTLARLGFDTLLRQGESGIIGGLATDWETVSSSEYTFTIRDDATCSDGTSITPSVVAGSFEYLTGLEDAGAQTWKNQAFGQGEASFTADDDAGTLTISLSEPYSQLIGGLTRPGTGIVCPAGIADPEGLAAGTVEGAWSGPYTLTDQQAGVSVTYTLREDYDAWPEWEGVEGEPATTINVSVQPDGNTSANLLTSGGIDVARFYDSNALQFSDEEGYTTSTFASSAYNLVFNEDPDSGSVFADNPELRAAVAQAIDTQGFNDAGLDGLGEEQYTVNSAGYNCALEEPSLVQAYDPQAASEVLTGQTIRLLIMSQWDPAADFLAESLRAAGATVEVSAPDPADWTAQMRTQPETWDLAVAAENAESGLIHLSIARYLGPTYAEGGTNVAYSDNPEASSSTRRR
ncbi:hypothetical protein A7K94_0200940 [Modestobacter sp. VKM Ac-2676]|nr:hypothetical protein A7K94_0200940 [Modestobacter sp. VKM Ac-2676]